MQDFGISNNSYTSSVSSANDFSASSVSNRDIANAVGNAYGAAIVDGLKDMIGQRGDIPQAKQDEIGEVLNAALDGGRLDTSAEATDLIDLILDMVRDAANEELKEADKSAGGEGGTGAASGGGSGNWLVTLAKAMGDVAGKHLGKMVALGNEITALGKTGGDAAAEQMPGLTAQMQAESQMFKMTQETVTTVVKTVGEALHSTARKQ